MVPRAGPGLPRPSARDGGAGVRRRWTISSTPSALDVAERFFWSGFTDTYVEMVKARARSETDAAGRGSAVAALQLGLKTFLRLFAPFLPYITEEVWSWGFAETERVRSIHHAPWPEAGDFAGLPPVEGGGAVFESAIGFLEAVNRAKSAAGGSVGRHVARLQVAASPATADLLERAMDDVLAAARVLPASDRAARRDGGRRLRGDGDRVRRRSRTLRPRPVRLEELVRLALEEDVGAARHHHHRYRRRRPERARGLPGQAGARRLRPGRRGNGLPDGGRPHHLRAPRSRRAQQVPSGADLGAVQGPARGMLDRRARRAELPPASLRRSPP